jgi:hypothetical protein
MVRNIQALRPIDWWVRSPLEVESGVGIGQPWIWGIRRRNCEGEKDELGGGRKEQRRLMKSLKTG